MNRQRSLLQFVNLSTGAARAERYTPTVAAIAARLRPRLARAWDDMVPLADEGELAEFRFTAGIEHGALFVSMVGPDDAVGAMFVTALGPNPLAWQEILAYAREATDLWPCPSVVPPASPWHAVAYAGPSGLDRRVEGLQMFLAWTWLTHYAPTHVTPEEEVV